MAALRNAEIHSRLARQEIAVEANVFAAEASQYSRRALLWLAATFIPAGLIAVISLGTYLDPQPVGENELASFISSRVLLFSLLITVLVWCIGNYRSNYHNFVVNRHRALSLGLYIRIQSVLSETNRNDLLTEVVRSIISPQTSGYAWHDGSSPPLNLVNQIARDVEK